MNRLPAWFAYGAMLTLLLAPLAPAATLQEIQISKSNRTVAITTEGEASAMADVAVVSIGFQSFGRTQDATYDAASGISNRIVAALTAAGIPKASIESTGQSLSPIQPDNNGDKTHYAGGDRFSFTQSWQVTVAASDAANVLHLAISAGANESGNIDWQLKDTDALQAEAARHALEHARQIATQMAAGLGAKLGDLLYASNQTPPAIPFSNLGRGAGGGIGRAVAKPATPVLLSIEPRRISRSATVYAAFAIE